MGLLSTIGSASARAYGFTRSAVSSIKDTYFNLVTLLLNTSSTNGAQNNTFLDSSSSPLTITRNGNVTQGTFTPFSQTGWSNYFDGADDDLSIASDVKLTPASGDFTIECWIFPTSWASAGSYRAVIGGPTSGCMFFGQTSTGFGLRSLATADIVVTTTLPTTNTWTHVAATRSGTTARLFINGVLTSTATDSTNFAQTQVVIANTSVAGTEDYAGYISNLRFVKGTALYTATFTPSTTPLTAVTNTQLLTCQSNRFVDNSTNAFSLSVGGTPSVQAFSPFAPTAAYDTAVVGGSGYFDGSGDYLTWAGSSIGTSQFCFECWFYCTSGISSDQALIGNYNTVTTGAFNVRKNSATVISIDAYGVAGYTFTVPTMSVNTWYHVAAVRNASNVCTIFLNGVRSSTGTQTLTNNFGSASSIGELNSAASRLFTGYIAGAKLIVGSTPYDPTSTTITIPTAPPTATTNTQLLLNSTNAGIYDSAAKNDLETVGNAQVSTTQAKWGTTSMYFDGTGDYLLYRSNALSSISGDFTVEGWIYPISWGSNSIIIGQTSSSQIGRYGSTGSAFGIVIAGGWVITDAALPSTSVWTHFAVVRQSGTVKIYINGTQSGSSASNTGTLSMNCVGSASGTGDYNGYIDDLRVTNYARYTANFTAPTAAFPIQ